MKKHFIIKSIAIAGGLFLTSLGGHAQDLANWTHTLEGRYPLTSMNRRAMKRLNHVYAASSITWA